MSFGAERLKNVSGEVFYPVTHTGCVFVNWHGETDFSTGSDGKTYKEKYVAIMSDHETDWIQKNTGYSVQGTFDYVYNYTKTSEYTALNKYASIINNNYPVRVIKSYADAVKFTQKTLEVALQVYGAPSETAKREWDTALVSEYTNDFTILSMFTPSGVYVEEFDMKPTSKLSCDYTGANFSYCVLPDDENGNPDPNRAPFIAPWSDYSTLCCGYESVGTFTEFSEHRQWNIGANCQEYLGAHNATFKELDKNNASITFWEITKAGSTTGSNVVTKANTEWSVLATIPLTKVTT